MKIALIGAGAQAKYALDIFQYDDEIEVIGIIDIMDNPDIWGKPYIGSKVLGGEDLIPNLPDFGAETSLVCAAPPQRKAELTAIAQNAGLSQTNAIHPQATIAHNATIGNGVIINAGAVIQPFATIGDGVMVHANVVIEHDNIIENYVNLAPGVTLAGWVHIEEGAVLYTGANIIPKVHVGEYAVVGAGAVVIQDVLPNTRVAGIPAAPI